MARLFRTEPELIPIPSVVSTPSASIGIRWRVSESIVHVHTAYSKGLIDGAELTALTILAKRARGATTGYLLYLESAEARNAAQQLSRKQRARRPKARNPRTDEPPNPENREK